jgi:hypothetical protein
MNTELRMVVPGNPRIVLQHLAFGDDDHDDDDDDREDADGR